MKKSKVGLSCEEGLLLSAGSGGGTREVKDGAGDCATVAREFGTCSVQHCENVFCLGDVVAVDGDDWLAEAEGAVSVTEVQAEETGFKDGLEKAGEGDLGGLHFGFARDV